MAVDRARREGHAVVTAAAPGIIHGQERSHRLTIAVVSDTQRVEHLATFVQEPVELVEPVVKVRKSRRSLWRILLTLAAAVLMIGAAFADWTGEGDFNGVCLHGADQCVSYDTYANAAINSGDKVGHLDSLPGGLQRLFDFATSVGVLALVLGLLALAGARSGTLTWFAGIVAILLAIVSAIVLRDAGPGAGLVMLFLGGICAVIAGALARRSSA